MYRYKFYRIRVAGLLSAAEAGWFEDLTICTPTATESVLLTPAIDQTALHGILATLRDLAIPLLAIEALDRHLDATQADAATAPLPALDARAAAGSAGAPGLAAAPQAVYSEGAPGVLLSGAHAEV